MNCILKITYSQTVGEETDCAELTTTAVVEGNENDYSVTYEEQTEDMKGCLTTLIVTNGSCVRISRKGAYQSDMCIERGKRHLCWYSTPQGDIYIGINTSLVHSEFDGTGNVKLDFSYSIDFNNSLVSENEIHIDAMSKEVN